MLKSYPNDFCFIRHESKRSLRPSAKTRKKGTEMKKVRKRKLNQTNRNGHEYNQRLQRQKISENWKYVLGTGMRNLLHLTFQTNETSKPRKPKVMQTITDTLTKKAILRLLLRNSTLMTRSKKRNLYSIANGRMLLTVKRNGLQRKLQNQDTFITWKQSKQLTTKSIRL